MPIPIAIIIADISAASVPNKLALANAKPTHIPSGMLCNAILMARSFVFTWLSSLGDDIFPKIKNIKYARTKHTDKINQAGKFNLSQYSTLGIINENTLDDNITPAEKEFKKDTNPFCGDFIIKTMAAPKHVSAKHKDVNKTTFSIALSKAFYFKYKKNVNYYFKNHWLFLLLCYT